VKKSSTELNVESEGAVRTKRLTPGSDLPAPLPVTLQGHEPLQRQHPHGREVDDTFLPRDLAKQSVQPPAAAAAAGGNRTAKLSQTLDAVGDTLSLRTGF
jgi:hypothetical protein